jgi:polyisoprenoid-binding protein YceI
LSDLRAAEHHHAAEEHDQLQRQHEETASMSTHATDSVGAPSIEKTPWRLDPERSSVEFNARAVWGIVTVKGRFSRFQGTLDFSSTPAIELTIEADSLDTRNEKRDTHLRSPDFFGVEQHPYVRFVSERVALEGERLEVRGFLHARGASMPLDIGATLRRTGDELEVEAVTVADHHRLGMTWNLMGMIRTPSELIVKGRLVRDA